MKKIGKLQFITTNATHAAQACKGGVDWVQLRIKDASYAEYFTVAKEVQAVCRKYGATFIINDNVQLALDIQVDGVHIGKEDMSPAEARAILGADFIIGCTSNTAEDISTLAAMPIDYLGLGPFRFTSTKEKLSPVLGIAGYKEIFNKLREQDIIPPPVIGIGGITEEDVSELLAAGLYGIAISGAIANADDITAAAKRFNKFFSYELQ